MTVYKHNDGVSHVSEMYHIPEHRLITDTGWLKPLALQLDESEIYFDDFTSGTVHLFWRPASKDYRVVVMPDDDEDEWIIRNYTRLNRARHIFHLAVMSMRYGGQWTKQFNATLTEENER